MPELKAAVLKEIKDSDLYKLYHKGATGEIDRSKIETEINTTGEALRRFHDLQRKLKLSTVLTNIPDEAKRDASSIFDLVERAKVVLLAQEGLISPADFDSFFDPLAGVVEGFLAAIRGGYLQRTKDIRDIRVECASKAFYRQMKKIIEAGKCGPAALKKACFSFGTHLAIRAEKTGKVSRDLEKEVLWVLESLRRKKSTAQCGKEIAIVKKWGLVE